MILLLAASALFYAWEIPWLLLLLAVSCVFNAFAVERILFHQESDNRTAAKHWLVGSVVTNLAFHAFFKYAGIFTGQLPARIQTESRDQPRIMLLGPPRRAQRAEGHAYPDTTLDRQSRVRRMELGECLLPAMIRHLRLA